MSRDGTQELGGPGNLECPSCLLWGVHTPIERWRRTQMRYCTFHYWLMKGREGFTLESYVDHSRHFGWGISLPSPEDMAKMNLAPELGMPELGSFLTLADKFPELRGEPLSLSLQVARRPEIMCREHMDQATQPDIQPHPRLRLPAELQIRCA